MMFSSTKQKLVDKFFPLIMVNIGYIHKTRSQDQIPTIDSYSEADKKLWMKYGDMLVKEFKRKEEANHNTYVDICDSDLGSFRSERDSILAEKKRKQEEKKMT